MLDLNAFVKGAIEGFLSSLALMIFFAILPLVSIKSTHLPYVREIWLGLLSRLIRQRSFSITLFKPEKFDNAGFSELDGKHFENEAF